MGPSPRITPVADVAACAASTDPADEAVTGSRAAAGPGAVPYPQVFPKLLLLGWQQRQQRLRLQQQIHGDGCHASQGCLLLLLLLLLPCLQKLVTFMGLNIAGKVGREATPSRTVCGSEASKQMQLVAFCAGICSQPSNPKCMQCGQNPAPAPLNLLSSVELLLLLLFLLHWLRL